MSALPPHPVRGRAARPHRLDARRAYSTGPAVFPSVSPGRWPGTPTGSFPGHAPGAVCARNNRKEGGPSRPVSRVLCPRRRYRQRGDDHLSRSGIAPALQQPTREHRTNRPQAPPYLVLLRMGFAVPPLSPAGRWALTPPFHPCPCPRFRGSSAVCSLWHFPSGCPAWELPSTLSCGARTFLPQRHRRGRPSGQLEPLAPLYHGVSGPTATPRRSPACGGPHAASDTLAL